MTHDTRYFVEVATADFTKDHGREPTSNADWKEVKERAHGMMMVRQAALDLHPEKVAGWKFGKNDIDWADA